MRASDLVAAFMLLTRLPVAALARGRPPNLARAVWAFPIVGLIVNGIGGTVYWVTWRVGMPGVLAAVWSLAAVMLIAGALHDDGLADTADGFGGGATAERVLAVMRDSRIGTYGALALLMSVSIRLTAIWTLNLPGRVMTGLVVAGALGRAAMVLVLLTSRPARADGMAAAIGKMPASSVVFGFALALFVALLWLGWLVGLMAAALAVGCGVMMARLATRRCGGHTGDVLGATEIFAECVVLSLVASVFR